ncbi:Ig-like domain-containing protein [Buttiauxella gaviniae]|uniref:Ig-like domain-containing protein n=1 Tax=Buttiauxella gaviniae TaxID=82990 RepID=A0ABV3NVT5_9ENTR
MSSLRKIERTHLFTDSRYIRPVAWILAGLQAFTPVALSAASVARVNTAPESLLRESATSYVLKQGETVWDVAARYGLTPDGLRHLNTGRTLDKLGAGDTVFVPASASTRAQPAPRAQAADPRDNQLASHLAIAAGLAKADNSQAAKSLATGLATGAISGAAGEWLSQFGTARVGLAVDQDMKLSGSSFDMLLPLYDNKQAMLFTQFGIRNKDERNTVNLGAGVRTFHTNWMFGGNVFLDNDLTGNNRRLGLGAEAWGDYLKLSGNYYLGLTDWHQSRDFADYDERPANGYDLRAEAYLPQYPQLGGKLMYEQYFGNEVALTGKNDRQKNPKALTTGLNYTPFPLLTVGAEHRMVSGGKSDSQVNMALTVRPSDSLAKHFDPDAVGLSRTLVGSRTDLVERNNHIVLDYRKQESLKLALPAQLSGPATSVLTVQASVQSRHGLQNIDWQAPQLVADGGTLKVTGADTLAITLPSKAAALPYVLSGVARDSRGHVSNRAVTHITVTEAPVSTTLSEKTVTPAVLPADGRSTAVVRLALRNAASEPVTGQSEQLRVAVEQNNLAMKSYRAMAAKLKDAPQASPSISAYKEISPGVYEALLTAGTQPVELSVITHFNDTMLKTALVSLVTPDSVSQGTPGAGTVTGNGAVANGTDTITVVFPVQDANGNPVPGQTVDITITFPDGSTETQTVVTDSNGNATVDVDSTQAGGVTVGASTGGASQTVTVDFTADASTATIAAGNLTIVTDNALADGTATNSVKVKVTDAHGNPLQNQQVAVSADNGAVVGNVSLTDVNGEVTVTLTSKTAGSSTVTAGINGASQTVDVNFRKGTGTPGAGTVTGDGAVANGTDIINVVFPVQDANGNPVPGQTVDITITFPDGSTETQTVVTDDDGNATIDVDSTQAGGVTVGASTGGGSQTVDVNFTADASTATIAAGNLTIVTDNALADGTATNSVKVKVTDAHGNPLQNQQVAVSADNGAVVGNISLTDANGEVTVTLTSKTAGSSTVSAGINGASQTVDVNFTADASTATIAAGNLTVVTDGALANGVATNSVRAIVTDSSGNRLTNVRVNFTANNSANIADSGHTDINGEVVVTLSSTKAGISTVTASINGASQTVDVNFTAGTGTPGAGTVTGDGAVANGTDIINVVFPVQDANGNPVPGQTVDITITFPDGSTETQTVVTDDDGNATIDVDSTQAGGVTVGASTGGASQTVDVNFTAGTGTPGAGTVTGDGAVANGTDTINVVFPVQDANGNPVPGQTVDITITFPDGSTETQTVVTDSNGNATVDVDSTQAGGVTVGASTGGGSQTVDINFTADASTATIAAGNLTVVDNGAYPNGTATNSVKVKVTDANGNALENGQITLTADNGATVGTVGLTDASGEVTVLLTSTTEGISTVTAEINGTSRTLNIEFGGAIILDVTTNERLANDFGRNEIRATVTDLNDEPVQGVSVTFNLPAGLNEVVTGAKTTGADGTVSTQIRSTVPGVSEVEADSGLAILATTDTEFDVPMPTHYLPGETGGSLLPVSSVPPIHTMGATIRFVDSDGQTLLASQWNNWVMTSANSTGWTSTTAGVYQLVSSRGRGNFTVSVTPSAQLQALGVAQKNISHYVARFVGTAPAAVGATLLETCVNNGWDGLLAPIATGFDSAHGPLHNYSNTTGFTVLLRNIYTTSKYVRMVKSDGTSNDFFFLNVNSPNSNTVLSNDQFERQMLTSEGVRPDAICVLNG